MKRFIVLISTLVLIIASFAGCGNEAGNDNNDYKKKMTAFFENVQKLDEQMNALDPESETSISDLFALLEQLEEQFKNFAEIEVPEEYIVTESLADEAYDYMKEANEYFRQSFSENSYNEYTLEAAMECYARANKRMHYVIDIIHGKLPDDENITYE